MRERDHLTVVLVARTGVLVRRSLRIAVLVLAAGFVLLVAGCGGGSNDAAPTPNPGSTGPTGQAGPTGTIAVFASKKNCRAFGHLAAQVSSAFAHEEGDASSLKSLSKRLQAMADAAPSDFKGDSQTVASVFAGYFHAIKRSGYDLSSRREKPPTAAQRAALVKAAKVFGAKKFAQAEGRLVDRVMRYCKRT
jgi:hypothetical protein